MLEACAALLGEAGFAQYEVSAYALAGRQCRHNLNYWTFGDYLGVGAGAHGKLSFAASGRIVRTVQPREPRRYLASVPSGVTRTAVPRRERPFEFMLNALRLVEGFETASFSERTGLDWEEVSKTMSSLVGKGLIVGQGTRYRATPRGL